MNIINTLENRFATKEFDDSTSLTDEQITQLKRLLQLSPSSVNIQPWHFILATDEAGKARVTKGTEPNYPFNTPKITKACANVVFCARIDTDDAYLQHLLTQEDNDGRYPKEEFKQMAQGARQSFSDLHRYDLKDHQHWLEKQVYLNMGVFLTGVAAMGLDAIPMEGVDVKGLDAEFGLREKGYAALAVVSVGYHADIEFNSPDKTPKSRLPQDEIITVL